MRAGMTELMLVTGGTHAGEFFRLLGNGHEHGIDGCSYAYQEKPGGIAEALGLAERFVDRDRVCVMLADNVLERIVPRLGRAVRTRRSEARASCSRASPTRRTCATSAFPSSTVTGAIARIVEKPDDPPSEYAVTGIYFYDETVWDVLPTLEPSGRGELEITDVNNWFVEQGTMEYDVLEGFWGDAGESIDAYYAVNDFVRANGANHDMIDGSSGYPARRYEDERGWLMELRRESALPKPTRQTNVSFSRAGVIRGLHYHERGQDDLFCCLSGTARVVVLDRETGETFTEDIGDDNPVAALHPRPSRARLRGAHRPRSSATT